MGALPGVDGGQVVAVYTNVGAGGAAQSVTLVTSDTGFTAGEGLVDVLSCVGYTADGSGNVAVELETLPVVLYPTAGVVGSGICGM